MSRYNSLVSPSTKDVREHPELAQYEQAASNPQVGTTWFYAEPSAGAAAPSGSGTVVLNPGGTVDRDLARSLNMYGVNGSAAQSSFAGNPSNPQVGTTWIQTDTASQNGAGGGSQSSFGSGSAAGSSSSAAPGSYAPDLQQSYMGAKYTTATPGQFEYAPAPVFNDPYQQALADANSAYYNKISTPFTYQKPADFTDPYRSTADSMLSQITNRQPFSYDYENDPVWQAYKKQYTREGRRASEDTMAQAAAMTGGIPSSYAVTAGAQAGNYYASQLSDKLPELYQMAYNRYLQEYQDKLSALSAVNNQTKIAQGVWEGNANNAWKGIGQDFDIYTTDIQNAYNNANLQRQLSNDAFDRYQTDLNQYNTNRNFDYGNYLDQIEYERDAEQTAYDRAKYLEDTGWKRGWDVDERDYERNVLHPEERADIEYERQLKFAIQMAEMGDTSFLEALGVDPTYYRALLDAQLADQLAQTAARTAKGSGSSGSSGGKSSGGAGGDDGDGAPTTEDEGFAADPRLQSIYDAAMSRGGLVTSKSDWDYLVEALGEENLPAYGLRYEDPNAAAATPTGTRQLSRADYYKKLYPDGVVTDMTDWADIISLYGNSGNARKNGFVFSGTPSAARTDKGAITYSASGTPSYDQTKITASPTGPYPQQRNDLSPVQPSYQAMYQEALTGQGGTTKNSVFSPASPAAGKTAPGTSAGTSSSAGTQAQASTSSGNGTVFGGRSGVVLPEIGSYTDARKELTSRSLPEEVVGAMLTEPQWMKRKTNGKGSFADGGVGKYDTYRDYVNAYVRWAIENYG